MHSFERQLRDQLHHCSKSRMALSRLPNQACSPAHGIGKNPSTQLSLPCSFPLQLWPSAGAKVVQQSPWPRHSVPLFLWNNTSFATLHPRSVQSSVPWAHSANAGLILVKAKGLIKRNRKPQRNCNGFLQPALRAGKCIFPPRQSGFFPPILPFFFRVEQPHHTPGTCCISPMHGWMLSVDHHAPPASCMLVLPPAQHQLFTKGNRNKTAWHLKRNHYHALVANQSWSALKLHRPMLN